MLYKKWSYVFFLRKAIEKYNTILPKKTGYLLIKREIANIDNISDLIRARKLVKKIIY